MSNSEITLGYWGLRGLGQPIRLIAAYLGLQLNDKRYGNVDDWLGENGDKFKLGLDFPNMPYLIDGDVKLTESRAILKYLARKYGKALYPSKLEEIGLCEMVENALFDIWLGCLRYFGNPDLEPMKKNFENDIPKKLGYLNAFLEGKKFALGDQITYVDFFLYEASYHLTQYKSDFLDQYSNYVQFKKRFEELPAIAQYMTSKDYIKSPCVNPYGKIAF